MYITRRHRCVTFLVLLSLLWHGFPAPTYAQVTGPVGLLFIGGGSAAPANNLLFRTPVTGNRAAGNMSALFAQARK